MKLQEVVFDATFTPDEAYLKSMPDLAEGDIKGSSTTIQKVGISNFHLPLRIMRKEGGVDDVEASIFGSVSLDGMKKGINMSRIIRTFYNYAENTYVFDINELCEVLKLYTEKLGSYDASIFIKFRYPIWQESLRSVDGNGQKNGGWQYYNITLEASIDRNQVVRKFLHLDFVYSSTCPCSTELSLHAMETRGAYATPHSQRSIMRVSTEFEDILWIEDLRDYILAALVTETQVFVKREDEQAFAELNAANTKFVEDAVRLVHQKLDSIAIIKDFKLVASHNESLHSHDAIAVLVKGVEGGFRDDISPAELKSLIY